MPPHLGEGEIREHVLRELRDEIRSLADQGLSAEEIQRRIDPYREPAGEGWELMHIGEDAIRALLGPALSEDAHDSRTLAVVVVLKMPYALWAVPVAEFLGWIRGSDDELVSEHMHAATIDSGAKLGELSAFQRAALIGALRLHDQVERAI